MDGRISFYCDMYQNYSARQIEWIQKNLIDSIDLYRYTMKEIYFVDHPSASEGEYNDWWHSILCNDWQNDIWFMSEEKFEYHWPMISAHFQQQKQEGE